MSHSMPFSSACRHCHSACCPEIITKVPAWLPRLSSGTKEHMAHLLKRPALYWRCVRRWGQKLLSRPTTSLQREWKSCVVHTGDRQSSDPQAGWELEGRCGGTGSKELGVGGAGSETSREPRTNPRTEISFSGILRQFQAKLDTFNSFPFLWAW